MLLDRASTRQSMAGALQDIAAVQATELVGVADVPVFENLANLRRLPPDGFVFIERPIRIDGGTGGPLRAIAITPRR